jgi:hypothetical protein
MRKATAKQTTLFTFVQRTDLVVTRHAADLLTEIALRTAAWRRKIKDAEFQKILLDYGLVAWVCASAGVLTSFLTAWLY